MDFVERAGPDGWCCDVLGSWRLSRAGEVVVLPPRDQRLLALLLIEGGGPHSHVAGLLWPNSSEARASSNLRSTTLDLRMRAPALVVSEGGGLALASSVRSDVSRLRDALLGRGPVRTAVEESDYLLGIRELLPGWYDDWVIAERSRLNEGVIDRMSRVLETLIDEEQIGHALPLARAAVHLEPMKESSLRSLARVHLLAGDRIAAWQTYADFRHQSIAEFGVAPSRQFDDLMEPLRAERRARKTSGDAGDGTSRPRRSGPTARP